MKEYDDGDCNTALRLGWNQNVPTRNVDPHALLDHLCSWSHPFNREIIDSSSSLKNEREGSRGCAEEIDFLRDFGRKKLRLTKDQTILLEESFERCSTLNTALKQSLAEKLCLTPRQVEVWFQNRRARSKLKQTEVECQSLQKTCERLTEENCLLKKELVELRSETKLQKPPATTLSHPKVVKMERYHSFDRN